MVLNKYVYSAVTNLQYVCCCSCSKKKQTEYICYLHLATKQLNFVLLDKLCAHLFRPRNLRHKVTRQHSSWETTKALSPLPMLKRPLPSLLLKLFMWRPTFCISSSILALKFSTACWRLCTSSLNWRLSSFNWRLSSFNWRLSSESVSNLISELQCDNEIESS